MNRRSIPFIFYVAAFGVILFILLPVFSTIISTTPDALHKTALDEEVVNSIRITFLSGAAATLIGGFTGLPLAYILARLSFPGKRVIEALIDLPVILPHTAAGIALLMVFGRQGIFGRWFAPYGIYFTDNFSGIVVGMLFVSLPFLINAAREAFLMVDVEIERMALLDGATSWQAFFQITLPQAWRGILSGALMMWARGISEFGAVVILAYHPTIIPVLIYERFAGFGLKAAQPVTVILIVVVLLVFGFLRWLSDRNK